MIIIRNNIDSHRQISEHFKAYELRCKCGKCDISLVDERFLECLEILRRVWGLPFTPTSVYRCQEHNRSLPNASAYSYHPRGQAGDLPLPPVELGKNAFIAYAMAIFPYCYIGDGFIHCDVRMP